MKNKQRRIMETKVTEIFRPWGGYSPDVVWVADMIIRKIFMYTNEKIEMLKMPPDFGISTIGNETIKHLNTKYTAYMILRKLGATDIQIEGEHWSDVFSPSLGIRVECGHTDPNRLIKSFHNYNNIKEFWILQYPTNTLSTTLYKFTLPEGDKEKLDKYQKMRSKIELEQLVRSMTREK